LHFNHPKKTNINFEPQTCKLKKTGEYFILVKHKMLFILGYNNKTSAHSLEQREYNLLKPIHIKNI